MSDRGMLGRRMPPSTGGDCEFGSRGMGKVEIAGELNDEEESEPDEARDTEN